MALRLFPTTVDLWQVDIFVLSLPFDILVLGCKYAGYTMSIYLVATMLNYSMVCNGLLDSCLYG